MTKIPIERILFMKRVAKRALAMLLAVMMLASMVPITVTTASAAEIAGVPNEGMTFDSDVLYQMPEIIRPAGSITLEAEVWISPDTTDNTRPGVILGNYSEAAGTSGDYGLELHRNGFVRLYVRNADCMFDASTALSGVSADELDIRNYVGTANDPKFVKITVVADTTAHKAILYINGKAVAEKKQNNLVDGVFAKSLTPHSVGGDIRSGNTCYFTGVVKNLGVYSDIRTEAEIKAYANATSYTNYVDPSDTALVAAFDLAAANALDDLSTADKDLVFTTNAGMTFKKEDPKIYFNKNLTDYPRTYEVEFYAPYETARKSDGVPTGRSGVLFGNWNNTGGQKPTLMLEIHDKGIPKLCMVNDASTSDNYDAKFDKVDVRQNGWVHMVIVNEGFTYHCYINGELVQTVTDTNKNFVPDVEAMQSVYKLSLGKDGRTNSKGNDSSIVFDGIMRNLALYTEPLTAEQ